MARLEQVITELKQAGIIGDLWIDGSFVTEKIDPKDVDVVLFVSERRRRAFTARQDKVLRWFYSNLSATHSCDSYIAFRFPRSHPEWKDGKQWQAYWLKQFGTGRSGARKGIIAVSIH